MPKTTWIEAALNGPWGRGLQPGIPVSPEEIIAEGIAAARAGAAIVHLHAYDPETGRQNDDVETYADVKCGWTFFLTNLKAFHEHGVDLREHAAERIRGGALNI